MHEKRKNSDVQLPVVLIFFVAIIVVVLLNRPSVEPPPLPTPTTTSNLTPTWPPLCATDAIPISVIYSSEVNFYLPEIMDRFNKLSAAGGSNPDTQKPLTVDGKPICVTGKSVSAGTAKTGLVNAIKAPSLQNALHPTIWSPSASTWLLLANFESGQPLFDIATTRDTALAPVVVAIWESRLQAIQKKLGLAIGSQGNIGWKELLTVLNSPNGWCDYGLTPCRPVVYYGHTNPNNSPTGLSTLIEEFIASARFNGFTGRKLTSEEVKDEQIRQGVKDIERLIKHYSDRTTEFVFYVAQGPDYVDFVALEENDVIYTNQGQKPDGSPITTPSTDRLVALYPKEGTFMHTHPFGMLNASWVSQEQHEAAEIFTDYVLTQAEQRFIMSKGFRPANTKVKLGYPIATETGVDPGQPATILDLPDTKTIYDIKDSWQYVKKQAAIMLLIDISGSMNEQDKLGQAKIAALKFLENIKADPMQKDALVGLSVFNDGVDLLVPLGTLETNLEALTQAIQSLGASGGTALYDGLLQSMDAFRTQDVDCKKQIHGIVLLSDGLNTAGTTNLQSVKNTIEASHKTLCPIIVIPVAYGSDADMEGLRSIARSATTDVQVGDPTTIQTVLNVIRGFF